MTDEIKLTQQAARGARAQALLNDELLRDTFAKQRQFYIDQWLISREEAVEFRESQYRNIKALERAQEDLKRTMTDGKLAQTQLDQLAQKRRRTPGA